MPVVLFFTIADADNDKSRIEIPVDATDPLANIQLIVETAWDIVQPLINGELISAGFTVEADITAFTNPVAAVISDVQEGAEFVFRTAGGFLKRLTIPTFLETLFTNGGAGKEVDTALPDVAAFNAAMTGGFVNGAVTVNPVDSRDDDIAAFVEGRQKWGKNRR